MKTTTIYKPRRAKLGHKSSEQSPCRIDHWYQLQHRHLREKFRMETLERNADRLRTAMRKRHKSKKNLDMSSKETRRYRGPNIRVTNHRGGSATSGRRPYGVWVFGEILRDARGIGRRFASYDAAERAGIVEIVRRRVQP